MNERDLAIQADELANRRYEFITRPEEDGRIRFHFPDLPGCYGMAEDWDELPSAIQDAKAAWIEAVLKKGRRIPEPSRTSEYSGTVFIRCTPSLHRRLAEKSKLEGVSLNAFCSQILTEYSTAEELVSKAAQRIVEPIETYLAKYAIFFNPNNVVGVPKPLCEKTEYEEFSKAG